MIRSCKPVIVLLGALAALDLAAAVLASRVTGTAKPPPPAVVSMVVLAVLTLVAMYGLWRGARWARPLVYVTRGFDVLSGLLGLADRPSVALDVIGVVTIVLSVAAIVLVVRAPGRRTDPPAPDGLRPTTRTGIANPSIPDQQFRRHRKEVRHEEADMGPIHRRPDLWHHRLGWGDIGLALFLSVFATVIVTHGKKPPATSSTPDGRAHWPSCS